MNKPSVRIMEWYLATLTVRVQAADSGLGDSTIARCYCLYSAVTAADAYAKATGSIETVMQRLSTFLPFNSDQFQFAGIEELVRLEQEPLHGNELYWQEMEVTSAQLEQLIYKKKDSPASAKNQPNSSGWYVGSVVLSEIHDYGTHGARMLVWINSYLVSAANAEDAYATLITIGKNESDSPGSHECDGDPAHWQFAGIHEVIHTLDAPRDGAFLWFSQDPLSTYIPRQQQELRVFQKRF